jgi:hypothetical protein
MDMIADNAAYQFADVVDQAIASQYAYEIPIS